MPILSDLLSENIKKNPDKTAVVCIESDLRLSFNDINKRINQLANALIDKGMQKGDRVAVLEYNCHRHIEIFFAAAKTGMLIVPLNYRLTGKELSFIINDSGAATLIFGKDFLDTISLIREDIKFVKNFIYIGNEIVKMENYENVILNSSPDEPDVDVNESDPVTLIYTSGTTGVPKGVVMTHKNWFVTTTNMAAELDINQNDVTLHVKPFFHVGPIWPMLSHFYAGGANIIIKAFEPQALLEAVENESVTNINTAPVMILWLLDYPNLKKYNLKSLRLLVYGASPMPVEILKRALSVFGNIMTQSYGSTEGLVLTRLEPNDHILEGSKEEVQRLGSCGKEAFNVKVKVVDDNSHEVKPGEIGEIIAKGKQITTGYWKRPDETAKTIKDGWFYTGDLATVDNKGYIYIVDRKKDMIISGGENIYPREIEEVIYKHPAVSEVSVIGVPDSTWGESVKAIIVAKAGKIVKENEIIEFCKNNLAGYKKPKSVEFVADMPRTPTGKILKRELKDKYRNI